MKKLFKTAMLAVAVVAAGYGGFKAYNAYNITQSEIGLENIEAFSYELAETEIHCEQDEGRCWKRDDHESWSWKYRKWGKCCTFDGRQKYYCWGVL